MSHCFTLPMIVQLEQLRTDVQNYAALRRIWDGIYEKSDAPLFHSFGFVGSLLGMDLRKETMSGV